MARTKTAVKPTDSAAEAAPGLETAATPMAEVATTTQEPPPSTKDAATAERPVEGERRPFPDVSEQKTVSVSPDGGLPDWAKQRLKADGWRDRVEDEGIYTKQLPPRAQPGEEDQGQASSRRRAGYEADRFFEKLANDIREERGMPPVRLNTAAVAER